MGVAGRIARLGVQVQPLTPQLGGAFGASEEAGLLVAVIVQGSLADRTGKILGQAGLSADSLSGPDSHRPFRLGLKGDDIWRPPSLQIQALATKNCEQ